MNVNATAVPVTTGRQSDEMRVSTVEDIARYNAVLAKMGIKDRIKAGPTTQALVPPKLSFGSAADAGNAAREIVTEAGTLVDRLNQLRQIRIDTANGSLSAQDRAKWEVSAAKREARDVELLRYYTGALSKNFRVSGQLVSRKEDGTYSFNAVKIGHKSFGTLFRVDTDGRILAPSERQSAPRARDAILDQRV